MTVGDVVLVLVTNPDSAPLLARLAAAVARPVGGRVVPLTVVPRSARASEREAAEQLVIATEHAAGARGVNSRGLVAVEDEVAAAVLEAAEEREASFVVMGWQGQSTHRNVFGEIIDSVVGRTRVPLGVARFGEAMWEGPWQRVLLTLAPHHLALQAGGLHLSATVSDRLRRDSGKLEILRSGTSNAPMPVAVAGLFAPVQHDARRHDLAVAACARPDDLLVLPVAPTGVGLRSATHLAWAAPASSMVVLVDAVPTRPENLAAAVQGAGKPKVIDLQGSDRPHQQQVVVVTARMPVDRALDVRAAAEALSSVGPVTDVEAWQETHRECARFRVHLTGADANSALRAVMTGLDRWSGAGGAEFRYEVSSSGALPEQPART